MKIRYLEEEASRIQFQKGRVQEAKEIYYRIDQMKREVVALEDKLEAP